MLTANAAVDLGANCLARLNRHIHELAYTILVELGERIVLEDLVVVVRAEELAGIVISISVKFMFFPPIKVINILTC